MDQLSTFLGKDQILQQGTFPIQPLLFPPVSDISILVDLVSDAPLLDESVLALLEQRNPENPAAPLFVPTQSAACLTILSSLGLSAVEIQQVNLGSTNGYISLVFNTTSHPVQFQVSWNAELVIDTGLRGDVSWNPSLNALVGSAVVGPASGVFSFYKNKTVSAAFVTVWDPFQTGDWSYYLTCPATAPIPPPVISPSPSSSPSASVDSASPSSSVSTDPSLSTSPSSSPSVSTDPSPSISTSPSSTSPSSSPSVSTAPSSSPSPSP